MILDIRFLKAHYAALQTNAQVLQCLETRERALDFLKTEQRERKTLISLLFQPIFTAQILLAGTRKPGFSEFLIFMIS